ncbi:U6 small nuclear RNA (adenine-(43)-N(6))-methyltransferase [Colletotrichum siamense]|nr:U6 small nuclear RNA (adenine-(43)-N(6))-methyltransferase [Colletotrichum siamense]
MAGEKRPYPDADDAQVECSSDSHKFRRIGRSTFEAPRPTKPGTHADAYYRDLYTGMHDYAALGKKHSKLGAKLSGNTLDFNDPHAVIALNSALLKEHFGLEVDLPADRLCPPIAQRHNYILWLKDLLDSTSYEQPNHRRVVGLDIGTGASCIFPLLGYTQRKWSFFATDIDEKSISYAKQNVKLNNLQRYISVIRRSPEEKLVNPEGLGVDHLDFVMTNPPFYTSEEEVRECEQAKATEQENHFTIAPNEQFTDGGEVAFVGRILEESLELREQVQWYTSMFGKKASLDAILEKLQEHKIDNFAVTEFIQGPNSKTKRWAVAWSFAAMRPSNKAARGLAAAQWRGILPPSTETEAIGFTLDRGVGVLANNLQELANSLELISWEWDREKLVGIGRAREDVWSRAWRRKKMREEREGKKPEDISTPEQCAFGFELALEVGAGRIKVICRWREGHSKPLYDSFCGFVKTKLSKFD